MDRPAVRALYGKAPVAALSLLRVLASALLFAAALSAAEGQPGSVTVFDREARYLYFPAQAQPPAPVAVLLESESSPWQQALTGLGWNVLKPQTPVSGDWGVKALEAMLANISKSGSTDPDRVFLIALGEFTPMAFYAASRAPHLWAGTLGVGGSPGPAIESNRLFGANTQALTVLWVMPKERDEMLDSYRARLSEAKFRFQVVASPEEALRTLSSLRRDPYPALVDCETGTSAFSRCYWLELTRADPKQRNDALLSSRVKPGPGAYLALGPFGYKITAEGPGVLVEWLPENYDGPLKIGDRITALDGKPVADAKDYLNRLEGIREEKPVAVMIQRGKDRKRVETHYRLARREETFTSRIQGQYLPDSREILLVTRAAAELRIDVPPQWAGAAVNWNGDISGKVDAPGCWMLSRAGLRRCQAP